MYNILAQVSRLTTLYVVKCWDPIFTSDTVQPVIKWYAIMVLHTLLWPVNILCSTITDTFQCKWPFRVIQLAGAVGACKGQVSSSKWSLCLTEDLKYLKRGLGLVQYRFWPFWWLSSCGLFLPCFEPFWFNFVVNVIEEGLF